jgi:ABC-type multidrug transport system fused ATPase/permease subunit
VALDRIATYLDEEEVSEQVSSLKRDEHRVRVRYTASYEEGLGIKNGSFKWNEVEETKDGSAEDPKGKSTAPSHESATPDASSVQSDASTHRFELKDINIMFPEGRLTVVTGPTASGKTALLVCRRLGSCCLLASLSRFSWRSLAR